MFGSSFVSFGVSHRFSRPEEVAEAIHRDLIAGGDVSVMFYRDGASFARLRRNGDDFEFESLKTGKHSLRVAVTDEARLRAHAVGFVEISRATLAPARVGDELIIWTR